MIAEIAEAPVLPPVFCTGCPRPIPDARSRCAFCGGRVHIWDPATQRLCAYCCAPFTPTDKPGMPKPRLYCTTGCRKKAYRDQHGIPDGKWRRGGPDA